MAEPSDDTTPRRAIGGLEEVLEMIRELRRLREIVEERSPIVAAHLAYQLNRPQTS